MKKTDKLRANAEKELQKAKRKGKVPESDSKLVHELQVHQIELEMQNEELRDSQREYQELSQKYLDLYNYAPVGYFTLDKNGNIIDVNLTGESILGIEKPNLISNPFILFVKPEFRNLFYNKIKNTIETRTKHELELELIKKDKTTFWALIGLNFTEDENYYRITAIDITNRKKAEKQSKEAHDTLELKVEERTSELKNALEEVSDLYNNAPCGYHSLDKDGYFIQINDTELDWLGYSRDEIIGKKKFTDLLTEESQKTFQKYFPSFKIRGNVYNLEFEMVRNDGSNFHVLLNATAVTDSNNYYIRSRSTIVDITERKQAETQLKNTIKKLEYSNRELQSFAYITSHDLQEPLRTMGSYAGLLKRRYEGQLDEDADDFLDYMIKGATRMKAQIEGLIDYSRVGTKGREFTELNSEETLNDALSNLHSSIEECHAEVTHDKLPIVVADKGQISRVFQNLIGNALKFRKKGVQPKIHISAKKKDNEYIFSVSDNGIGIEEQYTDRIFEVFKRLHAIDEYQGAGIGLAVVKKIIDRHGGHIWVESSFGEGSNFYFTLPDNT